MNNDEGNGDAMTEENKINFDLSTLTLEELIEVYENIEIFLDFLEESKIETEENPAICETWMSLEGIMLGEINQSQKDKYYMVTLIGHI